MYHQLRTDSIEELLPLLPPQWRPALIPCNHNKQPVNPRTGELVSGVDDTYWETADLIAAPALGLRMGPISGGTAAVDLDGPPSVESFIDYTGHNPDELYGTPVVTSGLPSRMQMLLQVAEHSWQQVRNLTLKAPGTNKEAVSFRWAGRYSLIAGAHPESPGYYFPPHCAPWEAPLKRCPLWLVDALKSENSANECPHRPHRSAAGDLRRTTPMPRVSAVSAFSAAELADRINPSQLSDYDSWFACGAALYHCTEGSAEGQALWDQLSAAAPKYPGSKRIDKKWHSFGRSSQSGRSYGWPTLKRLAGVQ